jgi:hydrogenase maturation protease
MDAHSLAPDAVIRLVSTLSGGRPPLGRVLVVGCEPEIVDVGMGLSACVTAALDPAVELVMSLFSDRSDEGGAHDSSTVEGDRDRDRRRSGDPVVAGRGAVSAVAGDVIPAAAACGGEV